VTQPSQPVLDADGVRARLEHDEQGAVARMFTEIAARYLARTRNSTGPVSTPRSARELTAQFAEPMPRRGRTLPHVLERLERDVLGDANQLMHPMYMGHQVSAPLAASVWSEVVIAALNQSLAVWEMSPTATIVETQVIRWMCELVGWDTASGGTFTSGGTEATFTALLAARGALLPDAWRDGVGADPPVVLCGEHAHYAVTRAVSELGLGMRNAIAVPSRDWRMDPAALAERLETLGRDGARVMAVVATAGSTATGSFDDLETIGALCEARGIWLHVDGAHGASALLSDTHAHRLRGLSHARSVACDPHKMMLMPLAAGMLLMRDERDLESTFSQRAPYLFHDAEGERVWDQGTRSFLCSRRADAIKLWVALQRYGADGIGALYDHLCGVTQALYEMIEERDDVEAMHAPECNILCFRVTAPSLAATERDALNRRLRAEYNRSGHGWITATTLNGEAVLRVTVMNPRTTVDHVRAMLDEICRMAALHQRQS
jgi:L-2,4-diaminobutyrate decarboxylase